MATYELQASEAEQKITAAGYSTSTAEAVSALLTELNLSSVTVTTAASATDIQAAVANNASVITYTAPEGTSDAGKTISLELTSDQKAVLLDTEASLDVSWTTVAGDPVLQTGSGDDQIIISGDGSMYIDSGAGNDTVVGSSGNDTILGGAGDDILLGGAGNDTINGGDGNDLINGGVGNDSISGGAGNDTIVAGTGNDTVDGGSGYDVIELAGNVSDYTTSVEDGVLTLKHSTTSTTVSDDGDTTTTITTVDATTIISNAEILSFSDGNTIALATDEEQASILNLYQTLLGRDADADGAEYWLDSGLSVSEIAQAFIDSDEYQASHSSDTDVQFLTALYEDALGREADYEGGVFWVDELESGVSRADVAASFAASAEAQTTIDNVIIVGQTDTDTSVS